MFGGFRSTLKYFTLFIGAAAGRVLQKLGVNPTFKGSDPCNPRTRDLDPRPPQKCCVKSSLSHLSPALPPLAWPRRPPQPCAQWARLRCPFPAAPRRASTLLAALPSSPLLATCSVSVCLSLCLWASFFVWSVLSVVAALAVVMILFPLVHFSPLFSCVQASSDPML